MRYRPRMRTSPIIPLAIPPAPLYLAFMTKTKRPSDSPFARFSAAVASHALMGGLLLLALSGDRRAR
ncbi:hypothetical protein AWJ14_08820 [Hoeflea olei]|uniref:Uncharacterized protein n=1 Tax=Hoeflea olei TaxID=1480615 RepID=A0A1C1Z0D1_9HYPH|nr:hypothetical protein AWJ14_08820 [Hoeflea olei]